MDDHSSARASEKREVKSKFSVCHSASAVEDGFSSPVAMSEAVRCYAAGGSGIGLGV